MAGFRSRRFRRVSLGRVILAIKDQPVLARWELSPAPQRRQCAQHTAQTPSKGALSSARIPNRVAHRG